MYFVLKEFFFFLHCVFRSPGGTPVGRRRSKGVSASLGDPAALIAEALKRKFAHNRLNNSSDKENSLDLSPFGSPETPKVCFPDVGEWKWTSLYLMSMLCGLVEHNPGVRGINALIWCFQVPHQTRRSQGRLLIWGLEIDHSQKKSQVFFTLPAKRHLTGLLLLQPWICRHLFCWSYVCTVFMFRPKVMFCIDCCEYGLIIVKRMAMWKCFYAKDYFERV